MRFGRALAVGASVVALAAGGRAQPPEDKTGPKVGAPAPAFKLKDQAGKERSLDEFTKAGPVAVVFHRSADW